VVSASLADDLAATSIQSVVMLLYVDSCFSTDQGHSASHHKEWNLVAMG